MLPCKVQTPIHPKHTSYIPGCTEHPVHPSYSSTASGLKKTKYHVCQSRTGQHFTTGQSPNEIRGSLAYAFFTALSQVKEGIWHIELPAHTHVLWPSNQLPFPGKSQPSFPRGAGSTANSFLHPLRCQPTSVTGQGAILGNSVQLKLKEANSPKKVLGPS